MFLAKIIFVYLFVCIVSEHGQRNPKWGRDGFALNGFSREG
jgi:hypothetical protein